MKRTLSLIAILLSISIPSFADVLHIVVDDTIQPISDEFIGRALDRAAAEKDDVVLIELRTPGGLEDSMRSIVEKILRSPVPVVVYVSPTGSRAASAGFVILESADIAAMAPGTNTGAAHPVILGQKMDDVMKMKLENDSAAFMRSIAAKRSRNVAVAESAIRESKSFTETEALNQKLIDVIAPDVATLINSIDGRTITRFNGVTSKLQLRSRTIRSYEMTVKEKVLSALMDPNIIFILFIIGVMSLFVEFNHPGAMVPGVIGTVSILLTIVAMNLLPTRYAALALLIASFVLFALEAKYVSHGVLGLGGVVCMIMGGLFLVDGPIPEMRVRLLTAIVASIPIAGITIALMTLALRARRNRVVTGREGMVGEIGIARTALTPDGRIFVHGELWNATASAEIAAGSQVRVERVDGLRVWVVPVEQFATGPVPAMHAGA
ncbi:MAG: nodulation protein NfeD [Acidobacteriota bacterium]